MPDRGPDASGCAHERVQFLTTAGAASDTAPEHVRTTILASWRRSRDHGVPADHVQVPYQRDPDLDTPLTRAAEPVIATLFGKLSDQAISVILTDPSGLVLRRRTHDPAFQRRLDRVLLAPGFSFAERFVGTNGIGTALASGTATQVLGHEHYAEDLETFGCAAAPIHDPLNGRLLGVLDLTCERRDVDSPLLLTLAETTAEQIQLALTQAAGQRELEVMHAYRQTCRRTSGLVLAITRDAVTVNDRVRSELDAGDQTALLTHAQEIGVTLAAGRRHNVDVTLPSGSPARLHCHQVDVDAQPAGVVVHVRLQTADAPRSRFRRRRAAWDTARTITALPGLVGSSPRLLAACDQVRDALDDGRWVIARGERGSGKRALLRAALLHRQPSMRFVVLDAALVTTGWPDEVRAALADADAVVITHADRLGDPDTRALTRLCAAARAGGDRPWVALTLDDGAERRAAREQLLTLFGVTVDVVPLRLRLDDIDALASFLLARMGHEHVGVSSDALRLLRRGTWPGNVEQLRGLLQQAVRRRRSGTLEVTDLPAEGHATTRRVLTPMEALERDAIVRSLGDSDGNKLEAARSLGISRATIYRKIRDYGIVTA